MSQDLELDFWAECMNASVLCFVLHNNLSAQFSDFPLYNVHTDFDEIEL